MTWKTIKTQYCFCFMLADVINYHFDFDIIGEYLIYYYFIKFYLFLH